MSISLIRFITTIGLDLKVNICSVCVPLLSIRSRHLNFIPLCYQAVPLLANYGTVPYSLIFILIQEVLQNEYGTVPERSNRNEEQNSTGW